MPHGDARILHAPEWEEFISNFVFSPGKKTKQRELYFQWEDCHISNYFCAADYLRLPKFSLTNRHIFREITQFFTKIVVDGPFSEVSRCWMLLSSPFSSGWDMGRFSPFFTVFIGIQIKWSKALSQCPCVRVVLEYFKVVCAFMNIFPWKSSQLKTSFTHVTPLKLKGDSESSGPAHHHRWANWIWQKLSGQCPPWLWPTGSFGHLHVWGKRKDNFQFQKQLLQTTPFPR